MTQGRLGSHCRETSPVCGEYRVGDYRLICTLEDTKLIVLVLRVGHRRGVYE